MNSRKIKAGFVGFGEVYSPRALIEEKVLATKRAFEARDIELVSTGTVTDDPERKDEMRAIDDLTGKDFDLLVIGVAGWIPSHTVIDVISHFAHKPMVLWGLTGCMDGERLVTTADQAGTTALRDPMDGLGFTFKYVYDTVDAPLAADDRVVRFGGAARAASLLKQAKIGFMGYRDMTLYATLVDGVSLRRVVGPEERSFRCTRCSN